MTAIYNKLIGTFGLTAALTGCVSQKDRGPEMAVISIDLAQPRVENPVVVSQKTILQPFDCPAKNQSFITTTVEPECLPKSLVPDFEAFDRQGDGFDRDELVDMYVQLPGKVSVRQQMLVRRAILAGYPADLEQKFTLGVRYQYAGETVRTACFNFVEDVSRQGEGGKVWKRRSSEP